MKFSEFQRTGSSLHKLLKIVVTFAYSDLFTINYIILRKGAALFKNSLSQLCLEKPEY